MPRRKRSDLETDLSQLVAVILKEFDEGADVSVDVSNFSHDENRYRSINIRVSRPPSWTRPEPAPEPSFPDVPPTPEPAA